MRKETPQFQYDDRQEPRPFSVSSRHFSRTSGDLALHPSSGTPSHLAEFSARAIFSGKEEAPYLLHWLQSGGNLDFCVLALCSCVLTVLCHQAPALSPVSTASQNTAPPAATQPSTVDLVIKTGLFTTTRTQQRPELLEDEDG